MDAAAQFTQAAALDDDGQTEAARAAYVAVLASTPTHFDTLNNLGSLYYRTGFRGAARTAFARAAACHPGRPDGHVNLAKLLAEDGESAPAQLHYMSALACDAECREAHQGLGNIFATLGDRDRAEKHWRHGWQDRVFTPWRYRGAGRPVRVLLLVSVADGNVPVRSFLDDRLFAVTAVATEFLDPTMTLPPHDVVFNAIGDADGCAEALAAAAQLVTDAPILNRPEAVLASGRMANARRLGAGPAIRAPRMALVDKADPDMPALRRSLGFPLLLRAPGFHTGQHFACVAQPENWEAIAATMPGEQLLAIEQLPTRGNDGLVRKCRAMILGGQVHPLHLAISRDWKVHYFSATMTEQAAFRAEEAHFLNDMEGYLGPRVCAGLAWIAATLGLDYAGVDFAVGADGTLLLFEANATMALNPPPDGRMWNYRRPAFQAAAAAARNLVVFHATKNRAVPDVQRASCGL